MHFSGFRPLPDLAATCPHGDRLRFLAGCCCEHGRVANAQYERKRQQARGEGDWNGIVSATAAQNHMRQLG